MTFFYIIISIIIHGICGGIACGLLDRDKYGSDIFGKSDYTLDCFLCCLFGFFALAIVAAKRKTEYKVLNDRKRELLLKKENIELIKEIRLLEAELDIGDD